MSVVIPETQAASRIASLVGTYIDRRYITDLALQDFAAKVVANSGTVRRILDEYEADPKRLGDRGKVLRQQASAHFDDQDWMLERIRELDVERAGWVAMLRGMGSPHVPEHDVDARGADEDDRRISTERRDDAAVDAAPRGIAS